MPRQARAARGGYVYHVMNRGHAGLTLFDAPADYEMFVRLLATTQAVAPMRLLAYCIMPTHWHLVLWPEHDTELSGYMARVSNTHVRHCQSQHPEHNGHFYGSRFRSFPVEEDAHLLTVLRYVNGNPLRARLTASAEQWPWSSLNPRLPDGTEIPLTDSPIHQPRNWLELVNQPLTDQELAALRTCAVRGRPYGSDPWVQHAARVLGLTFTLRPRGRPRKTFRPAARLLVG